VLTIGSIKGLSASISLIPTGGQTPPIEIAGERLPWKKAQKKGKKSIASDTRNNSIPYLRANCTLNV